MGIRFYCPNGHKLNVKNFQAGQRGICPYCGAGTEIPLTSTRLSSREERTRRTDGKAALSTATATVAPLGSLATALSGGVAEQARVEPTRAQSGLAGTFASSLLGGPSSPLPAPGGIAAPASAAVNSGSTASPSHLAPVPPPATAAVAPDPLAEAANLAWYVRPSAGGQYGPATPDMMRVWLAEGRVPPDALVWREGWRDWRVAREIFPQLRGGDPTFGMTTVLRPPALAPNEPIKKIHPIKRRSRHRMQIAMVVVLAAAGLFSAAVLLVVLLR